MLTTAHQFNRKGVIKVVSKHSSDGRSLDTFWLDHTQATPEDRYATFLLLEILDTSSMVDSYTVYHENGEVSIRKKHPDKETT